MFPIILVFIFVSIELVVGRLLEARVDREPMLAGAKQLPNTFSPVSDGLPWDK